MPILCGSITFVCLSVLAGIQADVYSAKASLTITDPTGVLDNTSLANLSNAIAKEQIAASTDRNITIRTDVATQSIEFKAVAATEEEAIASANNAADVVMESVKDSLEQQSDAYWGVVEETGSFRADEAPYLGGTSPLDRVAALRSCVFNVSAASEASDEKGVGALKLAIVAALGGLLVAILIVLIKNSIRRPIKGASDVLSAVDVPVLVNNPRDLGAGHLWQNIIHAADDRFESLCVIPVTGGVGADIVDAIAHEAKSTFDVVRVADSDGNTGDAGEGSLTIVNCASIQCDFNGALLAARSDVVVVVARLWADDVPALQETVSELEFVNAKVIGVILDNQSV